MRKSTTTFRTATGQTGTDAYKFELAQIANAKRDLDARMARLQEAMAAELPETATYKMSIATERFPDAFLVADAQTIRAQVTMFPWVDTVSLETVTNILATLKF